MKAPRRIPRRESRCSSEPLRASLETTPQALSGADEADVSPPSPTRPGRQEGALDRNLIGRFLRVEGIAEALGVNRRTVHRWIADGTLPSVRIGGTRLVAEQDLLAVLGRSR